MSESMGTETKEEVHWLHQLRDSQIRHRTGPAADYHWYDPFTWNTGPKLGLTCGGSYWAATALKTFITKQPAFAGLLWKSVWSLPFIGLGFYTGKFYDYHLGVRDRIIDHYVELHPQDFEQLNPANARKFADLLLPWYPVRTQQTSAIRLGVPPRSATELH